ncbi:biopolymer transporter ExbD [Pyxidicoccus fallax]|uniref:Biopolymer transporter ExbD n=1 Tax=Pyxidicoccus fallax TaxID=394095 RepID=A0A848LR59_9BACT|nr:biopolymer transporter ExbD [Pyxidicoccus fallax]NMO20043.1 biopolymer transporter ExbD [Pyxidicoccus fallax]NPC80673.1 biopolymer transporter ExbD [Pyxidicoccus fallax]
MAFHYSRRKLKVREEEETGELNIVPYLDILMNLIIFMLLSITGLTTFGILNVNAPAYGAPSAGVTQEGDDKPKLTLSVLISKKGHFVSSENAVLTAEGAAAAGPTIPVRADGTYDFTALNAKMLEIKAAFPEETKVIVGADPDIPYESLTQTLDAIRETQGKERRLLFPDVTLGAI